MRLKYDFSELCADESSSLQKYAEVPLFWFPRLTNLQPVQYMGDNETVVQFTFLATPVESVMV